MQVKLAFYAQIMLIFQSLKSALFYLEDKI